MICSLFVLPIVLKCIFLLSHLTKMEWDNGFEPLAQFVSMDLQKCKYAMCFYVIVFMEI